MQGILSIGDRYEVRDATSPLPSKCTVRYVGSISKDAANDGSCSGGNAEGEVWVGVEWDDENRGKNNGCAFGVQYFKARADKSASFIKMEKFLKVLLPRRTLKEALLSKYQCSKCENKENIGNNDPESQDDMYIMSVSGKKQIPVLLVGKDKIEQQFEDLSKLSKAGLQQQGIFTCIKGELKSLCPNLTYLDLSHNLLGSWSSIEQILDEVPLLETLLLTGTRFVTGDIKVSENSEEKVFPSLKVLVLNNTMLTWDEIHCIKMRFPNLTDIHLCDNQLKSISSLKKENWQKLRLINFTNNKLSSWKNDIWPFSQLGALEVLNLNKNQIDSVQYSDGTEMEQASGGKPFSSLCTLLIGQNLIADWDTINELNKFPSLTELRIDENLLQQKHGETKARTTTISKIKNLTQLNGSFIKAKEREDCEKYYLRQCGQELIDQHPDKKSSLLSLHPRYDELVQKYGDPCEFLKKTCNNEEKLSSKMIRLFIKNMAHSTGKVGAIIKPKVTPSTTIYKLKLLCKKWGIEPELQRLYYLEDESTPFPEVLQDDMTISYYEFDINGSEMKGVILMEEVDLEEEKRKKEMKEKEELDRMKKQEQDMDRQMKWQQQFYS